VSKRFVALLAALAALALIVAGCGGGSSSTESTSSLSKAEFVKKGNAICAKNEKKIQKTFETFAEEHNFSEKNPPSEKELQELSGELLPVVRSQIDEIRALGIPQGDEKEVEAIFAAAEEGIEETEKNPSVISEPGGGPFKKANKLSRDYGLTTCGEEGEASGGE
jgi:hypothetical protein